MVRRDALLRLYKRLRARQAVLRNAVAGELENLRRFRRDQTGDIADVAFDSGSQEIASQLAELEARELAQIERALTRLKEGTYGICEVCQDPIPVVRLNALPYITTCISCQREMESNPGWESRRRADWAEIRDVSAMEP